MTRDELFSQIKSALMYGIEVGENVSEIYLLSICKYINEETNNRALFEGDRLLVESPSYEPILSLEVKKDTLFINPLGEDDFFSSFMSILKYIAKKHKKEEEVYDDEFDWV